MGKIERVSKEFMEFERCWEDSKRFWRVFEGHFERGLKWLRRVLKACLGLDNGFSG